MIYTKINIICANWLLSEFECYSKSWRDVSVRKNTHYSVCDIKVIWNLRTQLFCSSRSFSIENYFSLTYLLSSWICQLLNSSDFQRYRNIRNSYVIGWIGKRSLSIRTILNLWLILWECLVLPGVSTVLEVTKLASLTRMQVRQVKPFFL